MSPIYDAPSLTSNRIPPCIFYRSYPCFSVPLHRLISLIDYPIHRKTVSPSSSGTDVHAFNTAFFIDWGIIFWSRPHLPRPSSFISLVLNATSHRFINRVPTVIFHTFCFSFLFHLSRRRVRDGAIACHSGHHRRPRRKPAQHTEEQRTPQAATESQDRHQCFICDIIFPLIRNYGQVNLNYQPLAKH